jgi:dethiobiotin synthetase
MINMTLIQGVFVTGTDTGVGKTQVTAGLAALLQQREEQRCSGQEAGGQHQRAGRSRNGRESMPSATQVRLWKPVQSGAALGAPDADSCRLLHGSGLPMREAEIATHTFEAPVAPWLAARAAGTPLLYRDLVADGKRRLQQGGCLLVEGAGGLLVPLAEEQRMADLAADLALPLLIIARTGLGTVNHTLLTVAAARQAGLMVLGVILNDSVPAPAFNPTTGGDAAIPSEDPAAPDQMARDNAYMIERFGEVPVLGILPWMPEGSWDKAGWAAWRARWTEEIDRSIRMEVFYQ